LLPKPAFPDQRRTEMKTGVKQIEELPSPSDVQGWKNVVAANRLRRLRPEAIVAVLQRLGPNGDQRLLSALITHISDELLRLIKRLVGKNQRNEGQDIIWRAHHQLIVAVLRPNSKDGQGLCKNFRKWVEYRVADARRAERLYAHRNQPYATKATTGDDGEETTETIEPADNKPADYAEQAAHVERFLSKITDPRKRDAFRLHMDGCPLAPGKGTTSIAEQLGISAKTAGEWIDEVQTLLKTEIGASNE
jgi:DNA-directed RNA polymerase specialized sigma24 family protein